MDRENSASFDIENPAPTPRELQPFPYKSIGEVPQPLRDFNEKACTPEVVSIGPLHYGTGNLQAMEERKKRYLNKLISLTKVSLDSYRDLVKQKEVQLRANYAEAIRFSSNDFVEIILVDAAFIIGFLLRLRFKKLRDEEDGIFGKPWMAQYIWLDMLLLENQLPFFILEDLFEYRTTFSISPGKPVGIYELVHYFFEELMGLEVADGKLAEIRHSKVAHFVDFLRQLNPTSYEADTGKVQAITPPSITELHQVGVKFKVGSRKNLFDFKFKNGVLEIPKLIISKESEKLFLNLLAFEQHYCGNNCISNYVCISDYVFIMNHLIKTEEDVNLVIKKGIVENKFRDNNQKVLLTNKLADLIYSNSGFYFASLCEELNNYCKSPWKRRMVDLMQNYMSTLWTTLSVVSAIALLVLGLVQTVFTIFSTIKPK